MRGSASYFDQIERLAHGVLKLPFNSFLDMTPRELANIREGHYADKDIQLRASWEQARYVAWVTACGNGAKLKAPVDMGEFAWEKFDEQEIDRREKAQARIFPKTIK